MMMIVRPQGLWPARPHARGAGPRQCRPKTRSGQEGSRRRLSAILEAHARHQAVRRPDGRQCNVDLSMPQRYIASVIGPNGAGKTTFFNCITGFYRPEQVRHAVFRRTVSLIGMSPRPGHCSAALPAHTRTFASSAITSPSLENILVGQHHAAAQRHRRRVAPACRTPRSEEKKALVDRAHEIAQFCWIGRLRAISWRRTCPTAISAVWRSRARWRAIRSCCCSMSRLQA
jgi:hypothetical protein